MKKKNIQGTPFILPEIFLQFSDSGVVFVDYQKLPLLSPVQTNATLASFSNNDGDGYENVS